MGTFSSSKHYSAGQEFIPMACRQIKDQFESEGFEYSVKSESFNRTVVNVTKGNLVKQAIGLKQGLEVSFAYSGGTVDVDVKGTVLKDQAIASAVSLFIAWPVLIPQIIGMVNQSKLDEKVISAVDSAYKVMKSNTPVFCTHCGHKVTSNDGKCPNCGNTLN